jgi:hypothetical protein
VAPRLLRISNYLVAARPIVRSAQRESRAIHQDAFVFAISRPRGSLQRSQQHLEWPAASNAAVVPWRIGVGYVYGRRKVTCLHLASGYRKQCGMLSPSSALPQSCLDFCGLLV